MENKEERYTLENISTGERVTWTIEEILTEVNRDRSDAWTDYDKSDWYEGLDTFTDWKLIQ